MEKKNPKQFQDHLNEFFSSHAIILNHLKESIYLFVVRPWERKEKQGKKRRRKKKNQQQATSKNSRQMLMFLLTVCVSPWTERICLSAFHLSLFLISLLGTSLAGPTV